MDATNQPGTTATQPTIGQPALATQPGSPWAARFWKTVLIIAAFYLALWVTMWLYIHSALGSHSVCPAPPYAPAGACAYGGDLHVPQWVYQSWKIREVSARQGTGKVGEILFKNLTGSEGSEGRGRTKVATLLIGGYLNTQAAALFRNSDLLISAGCQVLDIYLTPGDLGLPALKVRCWLYN
jgi:hypothetical protein